jgi:hypothetical protein
MPIEINPHQSVQVLVALLNPTWLNLVFNVAADFGEGFVQVLGSIQWRPASSIGVSRRPASSMPRPVA